MNHNKTLVEIFKKLASNRESRGRVVQFLLDNYSIPDIENDGNGMTPSKEDWEVAINNILGVTPYSSRKLNLVVSVLPDDKGDKKVDIYALESGTGERVDVETLLWGECLAMRVDKDTWADFDDITGETCIEELMAYCIGWMTCFGIKEETHNKMAEELKLMEEE